VATEDPNAYQRQTPVWCFRDLDVRGSPWAWEESDAKLLIKALERLKGLARSTWMQIEQDPGRKSNGAIEIDKLDGDAKKRIQALNLGQFDPFYHLRVESRVRVWGYRVGRVLHVVWLDPKHTVYPTLAE